MHIRPTLPCDIPQLIAVERSAAQAFARIPELAWLAAGDVLDIASHQAFIADQCSWLVEDAQGQVLGFACASEEDQALHIHEISVRLEAQGQGIGRRLLDHLRGVAQALNARQLTLTTFIDVPWNAPFYSRYGFEQLAQGQLSTALRNLLMVEEAQGLSGRCAMRLLVR